MMLRGLRLVALAALSTPVVVPALAPTLAHAQAYRCVPPARVELPRDPPRADGPVRRVPVARYTLAVSWSPEFCRGDDARRPGNRMQCSGENGRFGFILHGLWPEAQTGPAPQWCAILPRPRPQTVRDNLCVTPVPFLIEHEWAKHGSCMARTPEDYYRTAGKLWRALRWPDADRLSLQDGLTAGDLRRAVAASNPRWQPGDIGLVLSRSGWLRELRLCYDRKLRPAACPRGALGPLDSAPLKIWRGL